MFGFGLLGCPVAQAVGRPQRLGIYTAQGAHKHLGKWGVSNKNFTLLNILPRYAQKYCEK